MADYLNVVFSQEQWLFDSDSFHRWARVIVYEDDYADTLDSGSPFLFRFDEEIYGTLKQKIHIGINEEEVDYKVDYVKHEEEIIKELLEGQNLNPQVILYTTSDLIKEAYYESYDNSLKLNCKTTEKKEIMYWITCGKNDCALLVAFEDLSDYKEGLEYLEENFY